MKGASSDTNPELPSKKRMLVRGLSRACPVCGQRGLFPNPLRMLEDCPRCGLHFERIEGHWIGAIGINTIVSFFTLAVAFTVIFLLTFPDFDVLATTMPVVAVAVVVPIAFFGSSRTLWTAIDLGMRPLEAHEIDWRAIGASTTDQRDSQARADTGGDQENES